MRHPIAATLLLLASFSAASPAQTPTAAPGTQGNPAQAFDGPLINLEMEMMGAVKAMPADKFNFSPASLNIPGAKFDGVRTFADQVKHVAQANYFYANSVSGAKPDADVRAIASLKGRDEIIAALAASFAFAHKQILTLTPQNSLEVVKGQYLQTRATLAAGLVSHGFDHYGQMVEYLRMNGIVPPASAK